MIDGKQGAFDENADRTDNELGKRRYFSSTEGPFQSANSIFLFYGGADRALIINSVIHRVRKYPEPVVVTGESGSGKSMMGLVLGQKLESDFNIIHFDHSRCEHDQLLSHLVIELVPELVTTGSFGADMNSNATALLETNEPSRILVALCDKLRRGTPAEKPVLLLVDAKNVEQSAYEMLLHLSQLINAHGRPFSCVIFSEQEGLSISSLEQDAVARQDAVASNRDSKHRDSRSQGVAIESSDELSAHRNKLAEFSHYKLRRLNLAETTEYLQHHMLLFDFTKRDLFTREMAYFIADRSKGNCAMINSLARNAFLLASLEGADRVTMGHLLVAGFPEKEEQSPSRLKELTQQYRRGITMIGAFVIGGAITASMLAATLYFFG